MKSSKTACGMKTSFRTISAPTRNCLGPDEELYNSVDHTMKKISLPAHRHKGKAFPARTFRSVREASTVTGLPRPDIEKGLRSFDYPDWKDVRVEEKAAREAREAREARDHQKEKGDEDARKCITTSRKASRLAFVLVESPCGPPFTGRRPRSSLQVGLEPTTHRLTVDCSTTELLEMVFYLFYDILPLSRGKSK